ncbi:hypothetical protein BD413DRAFT_590154 [Trametes elegans]|nr:hypothetical protein BD413DRAFT_590154 [Trametes elegans]
MPLTRTADRGPAPGAGSLGSQAIGHFPQTIALHAQGQPTVECPPPTVLRARHYLWRQKDKPPTAGKKASDARASAHRFSPGAAHAGGPSSRPSTGAFWHTLCLPPSAHGCPRSTLDAAHALLRLPTRAWVPLSRPALTADGAARRRCCRRRRPVPRLSFQPGMGVAYRLCCMSHKPGGRYRPAIVPPHARARDSSSTSGAGTGA